MSLRSFIDVVIFCPGNSVEVARCVARMLGECARVRVWESAFSGHLSKDWVNALIKILSEVNYAVFLLPPDGRGPKDRSESRQNLNFEFGAAVIGLGRESVFLICDSKADLSHYLRSVVPTVYDSSDPRTLKKACGAVAGKIVAARFSHLSGEWLSEYLAHFMRKTPLTIERVMVVGLAAGIKIKSVENDLDDYYGATASFDLSNRSFQGPWKTNDRSRDGWFVLYISQCGKIMYGRYTGRDECGKEIEGYWVLAKNDASEEEVMARLREGRSKLPRIIERSPARRALRGLKEKARAFNSKLLGLFMMF